MVMRNDIPKYDLLILSCIALLAYIHMSINRVALFFPIIFINYWLIILSIGYSKIGTVKIFVE